VLVPAVEFVSAPGTSPAHVHRPGGPYALVTGRCVFRFDRERGRFRLQSVHPGHTIHEVLAHTGFEFDVPEPLFETPAPTPRTLALIRGPVGAAIGQTYPRFAEQVLAIGSGHAAAAPS
jgi:glutaconate CoA-transferase subunit B